MEVADHEIYDAGACVFEEGAPSDALFLVLTGEVEISKRTPGGQTQVLARIQPNDYFGEMGVVDGSPRSASAHAVSGTRLARLSADLLLQALTGERSEAILNLFRRISSRLRATNDDYLDGAFHSERHQLLLETVRSLSSKLEAPRLSVLDALAGVMSKIQDQSLRSECELARHQMERMAAELEAIEQYARGEAPSLEKAALPVVDLLEELEMRNRAYLQAHRVAMTMQGCTEEVSVDVGRLLVAFQNLLENAVESMAGEPGEVHVECHWRPSEVQISMRDTGCGIPCEIHDRIFKPCVTSGKDTALGLGLTVAERIVQAHGGSITFMTEEGEGSTFSVTIPTSA